MQGWLRALVMAPSVMGPGLPPACRLLAVPDAMRRMLACADVGLDCQLMRAWSEYTHPSQGVVAAGDEEEGGVGWGGWAVHAQKYHHQPSLLTGI